MSGDVTPGSTPRQMIVEAQVKVSEPIGQLHIARAMHDKDAIETVAKRLHARTLLYHRQISRYCDNEAIADIWEEDLGVDSDMQLSLESISELRMRNESTTRTRFDADRNKQVRENVERAWTMDPELALVVNDQLDRCAEALGVSITPDDDDDEGIIAGEI